MDPLGRLFGDHDVSEEKESGRMTQRGRRGLAIGLFFALSSLIAILALPLPPLRLSSSLLFRSVMAQ